MSNEKPWTEVLPLSRWADAVIAAQDISAALRVVCEITDTAAAVGVAYVKTAADAAAWWGVSERRARAHIARLHKQHGIARPLRHRADEQVTDWLITQAEIEQHEPGRPGRPRRPA